jgi:hypothetical protein
MSTASTKTIPVKGYLTPDAYLDLKAVFAPIGLSMSSAICLGLHQLSTSITQREPAHRIRRKGQPHMPKTGLPSVTRAPRAAPGRRGRTCERMLV